ncbi:MAG: LAGLIDADG family homing endonuclease [bacterium]|nr:LAGLIDADG family homing endonuclease [bacterium]
MRGYFRNTILNKNKLLQSYIIGLSIGDGNLSNPNKRATRLRITCDKKYPILIKKIYKTISLLLPDNKVNITNRSENCLDISIYSNHLEKILGWKAKGGSKFLQKVSVPGWIKKDNKYKINCLRGLIETDGCIYSDRGYKMMMFSTVIPKLANDFYEMVSSFGFKPRIYKIKRGKNIKYKFNQQPIYRIRLSKNVNNFLKLVKPKKT